MGTANWKLPYPTQDSRVSTWRTTGSYRLPNGDKSPWKKYLNFCKELKRTGCTYNVTCLDLGTHLRVLVEYTTKLQKSSAAGST